MKKTRVLVLAAALALASACGAETLTAPQNDDKSTQPAEPPPEPPTGPTTTGGPGTVGSGN